MRQMIASADCLSDCSVRQRTILGHNQECKLMIPALLLQIIIYKNETNASIHLDIKFHPCLQPVTLS